MSWPLDTSMASQLLEHEIAQAELLGRTTWLEPAKIADTMDPPCEPKAKDSSPPNWKVLAALTLFALVIQPSFLTWCGSF